MMWLAVLCACSAAACLLPPASRRVAAPDPAELVDERGLVTRGRWLWVALAVVGGTTLAPDRLAIGSGVVAGVVVLLILVRAEPPAVRRHREAVRRDLPHVVELYAAALAAGSAPGPALAQVCSALPGGAALELRGVRAGLALGRPPLEVWQELSAHPALGPLGRTMARAQQSGAPVVDAVRLLADDLAATARVELEDRARAVGVKAALPLGLCLLPAFLLLGIVPLVVGAATAIQW
jgi:pilus assembly protein TadC